MSAVVVSLFKVFQCLILVGFSILRNRHKMSWLEIFVWSFSNLYYIPITVDFAPL